ncbi:hypothetical protein QJ854_gp368 [Moumouvirus goulette]|uniref:Uncharacterized protein n=1 Tax=Moumouvirus goulette TaxID=1247379 RepID=M1PBW7_9VIRU|nr:hypothetical protein QJ854_gp368 [Moumouvirus goulette]AGF85414.1 hypothetical protein glt_00605 [Moumouvirus goulette]
MKLIILLLIVVIIFIVIFMIQKSNKNTNDDINKNTNFQEKFKETNEKLPNINNKKKFYHVKKNIYPNISSNRIKISELIKIINKNYSSDIIFNLADNPIIKTSDNHNNIFTIVSNKIKKDINFWNSKLLKSNYKTCIQITNIIPCVINQTIDEFITETLIHAKIQHQDVYFKIIYYGSMDKNIDFFNNNVSNKYIIQFVKMSLLTKEMYQNITENIKINENPFMTMNEQMDYVKKINELHKKEME